MAFSSSQFIQFPCTTFTSTPPNLTKPRPLPPRTSLTFSNLPTLSESTRHGTKSSALDNNDSSSYPDNSFSITALDDEKEVVVIVSEVDELKKELVCLFYGTNRGLNAASETRGEIAEAISKLEAKNPTAAPMEALNVLNGKWILAYTSFVGLYPLLSSGLLPLLKVEEISQTIDSRNLTVENSVVFSGPLATTSISTNATYQVKSPKRVQIKFEEGVIGTPQVTDFITIPEQLQIFGQDIDIPQLKELINSVQDTANSVAKTISNQPPLKFSISHTNAQSWLLTTYLDDDLRVSKLDDGSAFILIKEGSPLLTP